MAQDRIPKKRRLNIAERWKIPQKRTERLMNATKKATRLLADGCILRQPGPKPRWSSPVFCPMRQEKKKLSLRRRIPGEPNLPGRMEFRAGLKFSRTGTVLCGQRGVKAFRPFHCFSLRRYAYYLNIQTPGGQNKRFNRNTSF